MVEKVCASRLWKYKNDSNFQKQRRHQGSQDVSNDSDFKATIKAPLNYTLTKNEDMVRNANNGLSTGFSIRLWNVGRDTCAKNNSKYNKKHKSRNICANK